MKNMDMNVDCQNNIENILLSSQKYDPKNDPLFAIAKIQTLKEFALIFENCAICLNSLNNPFKLKNCKHIFCKKCILTWSRYSKCCPICRSKLRFNPSK